MPVDLKAEANKKRAAQEPALAALNKPKGSQSLDPGPAMTKALATQASGSIADIPAQKGLRRGVNPKDIVLPDFAQPEKEVGYGTPLFVLDRGNKGCGKSSDAASPIIPRPFGGPAVIVTTSRETRKGIVDRWGQGVLNKIRLMELLDYDGTDVDSAALIFAKLDAFADKCIDEWHPDNVMVDDLQHIYEEIAPDVIRNREGMDAMDPIRNIGLWGDRKTLGVKTAGKLLKTASHMLTVTGYDEEEKTVEKTVTDHKGNTKTMFVKELVPPKWCGPFKKPFDVMLVRSLADIEGVGKRRRLIEVESSKVNRLFPEGTTLDVTGVGVARFFQEYEAKVKSGLFKALDAIPDPEPPAVPAPEPRKVDVAKDPRAAVLALVGVLDTGNGASWEDLIKRLAEQGIDERQAEESFNALLDQGVIMEPVLGRLKHA